jgi:DNA-binding MarR family transcriptional regulator
MRIARSLSRTETNCVLLFLNGLLRARLRSRSQPRAHIHLYARLHRRPPAEADMRQYFRVSPPSVHQMVLTLEREGLIRRQSGTARSIELLVDPKCLPELL